ncbi:MAG: MFS transporter [Dehalococcoidia bacterium]|jgi:MFS family permease
MQQIYKKQRANLGINRNVFVLGWVSFFTDASSEMIFRAFPLFLSSVLGLSSSIIGTIEGSGYSAANFIKIASGWCSDKLGERKWITASGYGLSTIVKPFLLIASGWGLALVIRVLERAGKGVRISPRDALIADCTTDGTAGRGFGFQKAMDSFGAMVGIAIAAVVIYFVLGPDTVLITKGVFHWLVIIGVIPAAIAVFLIIFFVKQTRASRAEREAASHISQPKILDKRFVIFLTVMALFNMGNSADAFLILRANNVGVSVFYVFLLLILYNLIYAVVSFPVGKLSDKIGRKKIIVVGWGIYVATYLLLALASSEWYMLIIAITYGLYGGLADGVSKAFVADIVAARRRGIAYGLYHGMVGFALLLASVIAGVLWDNINPSAAFYFGAAMSGLAMVGMMFFVKELHTPAK